MSQPVTDAVILMAGSGSRFNNGEIKRRKPLIDLFGRPLISHTLEALARAGIVRVWAVIGFEGDALRGEVEPLVPSGIEMRWIDNPQWQLQNGVSALAAAPHVSEPFILTMADHFFEPAIVDLLVREARPDFLNVAIDRKLDTIFDMADAMKVQMRGERVMAVGKSLPNYNAIDTGLFVCPSELFRYLEKAKVNGDCSLAAGVGAMAKDGRVRGIDIGEAWWQDVDTPEMLRHAQSRMTVTS